MSKEFETLDIITVIGFCLALLNYRENLKQTSNNELLKELHSQDDLINDKIIDKLTIIEKQNQLILQYLKGN